jgi:hypothetical protein
MYKAILVALPAIVGLIAGRFFKDTGMAVAIEAAVDRMTHAAGMERPEMIGAAVPYVITIAICYALGVAAYRLGAQELLERPDFDLLYDPNDPRFASREETETQYRVALHILCRKRVPFPNVRARESEFTARILSNFGRLEPSGAVQLYEGGALDHKDIELILLCRLPNYDFLNLEGPDDPRGHIQRFVLEARGANTTTRRFEFEYDPLRIPMIRKIGR